MFKSSEGHIALGKIYILELLKGLKRISALNVPLKSIKVIFVLNNKPY